MDSPRNSGEVGDTEQNRGNQATWQNGDFKTG